VSYNNRKSKISFPVRFFSFAFLLVFLLNACSFDYGAGQEDDRGRPDIIMENIEYARVRGGDLLARFHAVHAEQWEERQIMGLWEFTFEQMEDQGETVNVEGRAGAAEVHLESGDIVLFNGVLVSIESEDLIINTTMLEWNDSEKTLAGGEEDEVEIQRSDGTSFVGRGFSADIRRRTWAFSGEAWGSFVDEDDEDDEDDNGDEDNGDDEDNVDNEV
jgi:LPS export ABC transporter protein LptC